MRVPPRNIVVTAFMCAYAEGKPRQITIPVEGAARAFLRSVAGEVGLLEAAFRFGQNEFCTFADSRQELPSVSPGDVMKLPNGNLYLCLASGWKPLPKETPVETLVTGIEAILASYINPGFTE